MRTGEDFPDGDGVEADGKADAEGVTPSIKLVANDGVSIGSMENFCVTR